MEEQAAALQSLVRQISADEDLADLSASAAAAQQTVQALAARQEASLEDMAQELLASPEILRCGTDASALQQDSVYHPYEGTLAEMYT